MFRGNIDSLIEMNNDINRPHSQMPFSDLCLPEVVLYPVLM